MSVQETPEEQRHVHTCCYGYLEGLVSAVGQHVSLEPALAGGWGVIHFTSLPQTHKHLEGEEEGEMSARAENLGVKCLKMT